MKMTFDIPDEQMSEVTRQVEENIRETVTDEVIANVIGDPKQMGFMELMTNARLHDRCAGYELSLKLVKDLSNEDKLLLVTKWMYELLMGDY